MEAASESRQVCLPKIKKTTFFFPEPIRLPPHPPFWSARACLRVVHTAEQMLTGTRRQVPNEAIAGQTVYCLLPRSGQIEQPSLEFNPVDLGGLGGCSHCCLMAGVVKQSETLQVAQE